MPKANSEPDFGYGRERLHEIIFETETRAGKTFDIILMIFILVSVAIVMMESVPSLDKKYHDEFLILEWAFTAFFTVEYILRLYCVHRPMKYATSFFGVIDLLAIIPTYIEFFIPGGHVAVVVRALRLLRVFRIFRLVSFVRQGLVISKALRASLPKISVFLFGILILVCILGSIMYLVEGSVNPTFDSIPRSVYWAIVTLTTVGYGDIAPITPFGQFLASMVMIMGYSIIAVPTGIITAESLKEAKKNIDYVTTVSCRYCLKEGHMDDALYCKYCGEKLNPDVLETSVVD